MKLNVKITIADDQNEEFMGIGLIWLLRRIKNSNPSIKLPRI